jgi:hypothetical protein
MRMEERERVQRRKERREGDISFSLLPYKDKGVGLVLVVFVGLVLFGVLFLCFLLLHGCWVCCVPLAARASFR